MIHISENLATSQASPIGVATGGNNMMHVRLHDPIQMRSVLEPFSDHRLILPLLDQPVQLERYDLGQPYSMIIEPGDFLAIPADTRRSIRWAEPVRAVEVAIAPDLLREFVEAEIGILAGPGRLAENFHLHDRRLVDLAGRLGAAVEDADIGAPILLDAMSRAFLVLLVRAHADRHAVAQSPSRSGLAPDRHRKLLDFVRSNLARTITRDQMAETVGLSPSGLTRALRATRRQTPHALVMALRLERAEELLANPHLPLGTIAFECGFADQAHFSRSFRKARGITPSAWRKARISGPH